jgi:polysulfide reductase chain C
MKQFKGAHEDVMEAHEWMIRSTYQTEWITRRGLFLWLAMYTGGLGGGLYLVSLYFGSVAGMAVSLFIVAGLKGAFHFAYLGRPWRFWRLMLRPRTSWIARGFILVVLFVVFSAGQLVLSFWRPGTAWEVVFKILAGITAFGVAVYTGFVLRSVKAVSLWDSPLLPVLFVTWSLMGGFGLSVIIALFGGQVDLHAAETGTWVMLMFNAFLLLAYLWTTARRDETGKKSVMDQMKGRASRVFWIGVVLLGVVVPLAIVSFSSLSGKGIPALMLAGVACEIVGGLCMRYCLLRVGMYKPLFPRPNYMNP